MLNGQKTPLARTHACLVASNTILLASWRGYITQRLLWETGNHLCFTRPTAIQERNDHDLIKDFIGEQDLYLKTEFLIDALRKWRPSKTNHIYEHCHDIYTYVIKNQFIRELELELINAWISDLRDIQEI